MSLFSLGSISDHSNGKTVFWVFLQFVLITSFLGYRSYGDSSAECVACHGNKQKMKALGYPQFFVTRDMVEKESNHPNVQCHDITSVTGGQKKLRKHIGES